MALLFKPPTSPFEPPSLAYRILSSPLKYVAQTLYSYILLARGSSITKDSSHPIRLVCISDTHTQQPTSFPPGDVLIHAGDLSNDGSVDEIQDQIDWLSSLPYAHIIAICGNHDSYFDPRSRRESDEGKRVEFGKVHYLQHSSIKLSFPKQGDRELIFYGAPQIPQCGGGDFAFQYRREDDAWTGTIPMDTDVLITHTSPRHHLDLPHGMGCQYLLKETWRIKPKLHIFGHVHAGYGKKYAFWDRPQELYENLCALGGRGVLRDLVAVFAWMDVIKLAVHGLMGILWTRVWGGSDDGTLLVNSSLMYRSTGQLRNPPQVIEI